MKIPGKACLGVALVLLLSVGAASAQSVTGPSTDSKLNGAAAPGPWSADATVARLVYGPIKILGMRRFTPRARVELKDHMERAESRVRAVMAGLSSGAIDAQEARSELADAIADYRVAVRELLSGR